MVPTYFVSIDEGMIFKAGCLTKGNCDPSHMDADQSRHILTSAKYKKDNKNLRDQRELENCIYIYIYIYILHGNNTTYDHIT